MTPSEIETVTKIHALQHRTTCYKLQQVEKQWDLLNCPKKRRIGIKKITNV